VFGDRFDRGEAASLLQYEWLTHFRSGSKAALTAPKFDFRFAPDNGLKSDIA
jgi:hypothetical protein